MYLDDHGIDRNSTISRPVTYGVTSFISISLYNVLELNFLLLVTFKRHNGLYFWSFFASTWGTAIYAIGFLLRDFHISSKITYLYVTLIAIGWVAMVTGQSLVLFSRLHLIVRKPLVLRCVLAMIIVDAIILQIPTIVLFYGANSHQFPRFVIPYAIFERVQVTLFFVQETIISGLYMYETWKMLYSEGSLNGVHGEVGRRLLQHLVYVNAIVVLLGIAIVVLEFTGRYASQTAARGFIYSVKLKVEFDILTRLVGLARRASDAEAGWAYTADSPGGFWDGQTGDGQGKDGIARRKSAFSCPWFALAKRAQREVNGPPRSRTASKREERS
ncbi:uncharacterized protein BDW47DRAFT_134008 [Aspergillus candidus]|uniref:DUF7703 domain-containing protein n=1 Tax=Aspergillus candidus TaxID=41067 RepID=A0A2I2F2E1_ASPCN|nr:hypothetical protein BDW47DRAFT_134008 [Aspergillus candidus]PLB34800.1 hypothetical protein BDW47DRAFT_134008 [Aspergillus candidus]